MISVLVLDGFSDSSLCVNSQVLSEIGDIFIPLLTGILRYNGVTCVTVKPSGLEHEYGINGKNSDNLIYVPIFSCAAEENTGVSFIYTDSTAPASVSFRIASKLRKLREEISESVTFVNSLHENDSLKKFSPVIVDNIRFSGASGACEILKNLYKTVLSVAKAVCEYYGVIFRDPSKTEY